jgi:hypothetical protein
MNLAILGLLIAVLLLLAFTYNRYLAGNLRQLLGLSSIALLAFANVMLATSLVVPFSDEYIRLQLIAAIVVAAGSTIGARKARSIAESGLRAYEKRRSSEKPTDAD